MIPLQVTAHMAGPVVASHPINLDALLAWSAAQEMGLTPPPKTAALSSFTPIPIPLVTVSYGGHDIALCSHMAAPGASPYCHDWTRRRDAQDVDRLARNYVPGLGPGRNVKRRGYGFQAPSVHWHTYGDPGEIRRLLGRCWRLGSLRSHGLGEILSWDVEPINETRLGVLTRDGLARRPIPATWALSPSVTRRLACQVPYWHRSRQVDAVDAGSPIELKRELLAVLVQL